MSWMNIIILIGYVVVLLGIMAFLHGVTLVCQDLRQRRIELRKEKQPESTMKRAA